MATKKKEAAPATSTETTPERTKAAAHFTVEGRKGSVELLVRDKVVASSDADPSKLYSELFTYVKARLEGKGG